MKVLWRSNLEDGLTLLEVAAVFVLMALVYSIVLPRFDYAYCRWRENTALLQLVSDLKEAESEAAGRRINVELEFDADKPYYLLKIGETALERPLWGWVPEPPAGEEGKFTIELGWGTSKQQEIILVGKHERVCRVWLAGGRPPEVLEQ